MSVMGKRFAGALVAGVTLGACLWSDHAASRGFGGGGGHFGGGGLHFGGAGLGGMRFGGGGIGGTRLGGGAFRFGGHNHFAAMRFASPATRFGHNRMNLGPVRANRTAFGGTRPINRPFAHANRAH